MYKGVITTPPNFVMSKFLTTIHVISAKCLLHYSNLAWAVEETFK